VKRDIGVRGQPSFVLFVGTVVVENDVDLAIGGLIFNDLGHEGLEIDALLGLCGLAADEPGGDFQGGKEVDRTVSLVGGFEALNDLTAAGSDIAGGPFQGLDRRLFVDAEHQRVRRRVEVQADNSAAFAANCGSVLTHHERCRRNWMPSLRNTRQTAASETPSAEANVPPSHPANPAGAGNSNCRRMRRRKSSPYFGFLPGRG